MNPLRWWMGLGTDVGPFAAAPDGSVTNVRTGQKYTALQMNEMMNLNASLLPFRIGVLGAVPGFLVAWWLFGRRK